MAGNPNYRRGRRWEWDLAKEWKARGWSVVRASGSHGEFDLICFRAGQKPHMIQAKVTKDRAWAKRACIEWARKAPEQYYHQSIEIKIHRTKEFFCATV